MAEYDYEKPTVHLPLDYARVLVSAAEEVQRMSDATTKVFGEPFVPSRLTFWDGNSGEESEWFIDVHDEMTWICLAPRKPIPAPPF